VVVAVGAGTADITARAVNGITSNACAVSVAANNIAVTGVTISPASLSLIAGSDVNHRTAWLSAQVYPPNAPTTNPVTPIIWTSSDPARATVSQAGLVEALAAGDVTITASYGTAANAPKGDCAVKIRNQ
ncbi:MAG: Ig-like domain-containing protein, partial [Holophagales bacterium]|nr:Ig-like domain-containing protein [Holophagales bacterium]